MSGKAVRNWRGNGKAVTKTISCGNGKQPPLNVNSNYSWQGHLPPPRPGLARVGMITITKRHTPSLKQRAPSSSQGPCGATGSRGAPRSPTPGAAAKGTSL